MMQSMQEFPPLHRSVMLWLLDFMVEIVQNAAVNKMTAKNLGTVSLPPHSCSLSS